MPRALRPVLYLFGVPAALIAFWFVFSELYGVPQYTYRYRLTIEVDTPQGLKSDSSVIETKLVNYQDSNWGPVRPFLSEARGDAVFVDLGEGRHIIALLALGPTGDDDLEFRRIAPLSLGVRWDTPEQTIPAIKRATERATEVELPKKLVPTLITFNDLNDSHSARVVSTDEFSDVFGAGYEFRRATIKMVSPGWWPLNAMGLSGTPVTATIQEKIPALFKILEGERMKSIRGFHGQPYTRMYRHFRRP